MNSIKDGLQGRFPLRRAFWVYYVGGSFVLCVIFGSILGILFNVFPDAQSRASLTVGAVIYSFLAFFLVYQVWALIAVWRSASNDKSVWGALAHIWVGIMILGFFMKVVAVYPHYAQIARDAAAKHQMSSQH